MAVCLQFLHNAFRFAFGATLPVEPCGETVHDCRQIRNQVLFIVLCHIDHLDLAPLGLEKRFKVVEAKEGEPVPMLNHYQGDARLFQQS
jgi:hypothetical protein